MCFAREALRWESAEDSSRGGRTLLRLPLCPDLAKSPVDSPELSWDPFPSPCLPASLPASPDPLSSPRAESTGPGANDPGKKKEGEGQETAKEEAAHSHLPDRRGSSQRSDCTSTQPSGLPIRAQVRPSAVRTTDVEPLRAQILATQQQRTVTSSRFLRQSHTQHSANSQPGLYRTRISISPPCASSQHRFLGLAWPLPLPSPSSLPPPPPPPSPSASPSLRPGWHAPLGPYPPRAASASPCPPFTLERRNVWTSPAQEPHLANLPRTSACHLLRLFPRTHLWQQARLCKPARTAFTHNGQWSPAFATLAPLQDALTILVPQTRYSIHCAVLRIGFSRPRL